MKKKMFFLLILFMPFMVSAEELQMEWQKSWGGNGDDYLKNVIETEDGNFILVGESYSKDIEGLPNKGSGDAIILKYDKNGNMIWQKSWGGNRNDYLKNAIETEDGSIILVGYTYSKDIEGLPNKGNQDAIILKYDKNGNMLWQKSWGGNDNDYLNNTIETEDGSIILFGNSTSTDIEGLPNKGIYDAIILKYDKNGNMIWQKSWGGKSVDNLINAIETEDGSIILFGETISTDIDGLPNKGDSDAVIIKYDKDGNMIWQKSWGGKGVDYFYNAIETEDGNFILVGESRSKDIEGLPNKGHEDFIILKYDKNGNMLWQKSLGGNGGDYFKNAIETEDGNFILVVESYSKDIEGLPNKGSGDAIILKYDKNGNMIWQKSWGGNSSESLKNVIEREEGNIMLFGGSSSTDIEGLPNKGSDDAIIIKYDKNGNMIWQKSWGGNGSDNFNNAIETEDGNIMLFGESTTTDIEGLPNKGSDDIILVKYSIEYDLGNVETENGSAELKQESKYGIITPTPNEGYEVDKIIVKDKSGNVLDVEVTKQEDGTYSFELYTDVSVEVLFKEKLVNPKTGVSSFIGVMFTLMLIGISGFFMIRNCNNSYEL